MEFGSDFHSLTWPQGLSYSQLLDHKNYYALGRHAMMAALETENCQKIWLPEYYCYESVVYPLKTEKQVRFYEILPTQNPIEVVKNLEIGKDDILVLMNYFGLWGHLETPSLKCRIIEDHSHDLTSHWALTSQADWCFASLRKTLPVAEGGVLWSPKGNPLPSMVMQNERHLRNAACRQEAMVQKAAYICGENIHKAKFLATFRQTENEFDVLPISPISVLCEQIVSQMDINTWYARKKDNWIRLVKQLRLPDGVRVLKPETVSVTPFSLILLFEIEKQREDVKRRLIAQNVFPAILWQIPAEHSRKVIDFSKRMLSIHCDGRYASGDISLLSTIINEVLCCGR